MTNKPPRLYVPLDANYYRDISIRKAGPMAELLYIRALAFAKSTGTGGFISTWDIQEISIGLSGGDSGARSGAIPPDLAAILVDVDLWEKAPNGWLIRSYERWNATEVSSSTSGREGNHLRWHVKRGIVELTCKFCQTIGGDSGGDIGGDSGGESGKTSPPDSKEKRRKEKITTPLGPPKGATDKPGLTVVPPVVAKATRAAPSRPLPEDFTITAEMKAWSDSQNLLAADVVKQTERFKTWALSVDKRYAKWDQAWRNWISKGVDRGEVRKRGAGAGPSRPAMHEWER